MSLTQPYYLHAIISVGVLDVNLPLTFDLGLLGYVLSWFLDDDNPLVIAMDLFPDLQPIVSITSDDLFSGEYPSFDLDLNLNGLVSEDSTNIIEGLFHKLTEGLQTVAISQLESRGYDAGPLGNIVGILDRYNIGFDDIVEGFMAFYDEFRMDAVGGDPELQELNEFKTFGAFSRFPALLELGSKNPAEQYPPDLQSLLWDKLVEEFPRSNYNGAKIPNLPLGSTFQETYPTRGDFPGECMTQETICF